MSNTWEVFGDWLRSEASKKSKELESLSKTNDKLNILSEKCEYITLLKVLVKYMEVDKESSEESKPELSEVFQESLTLCQHYHKKLNGIHLMWCTKTDRPAVICGGNRLHCFLNPQEDKND